MQGLSLPADAQDLMTIVQAQHPELKNFSFASDCIKAQNDLGQFTHFMYRTIRKNTARRALEASAAPIPTDPGDLRGTDLRGTDLRRA